jgi:predicted RND superfamily exporter protein
MMPPLIMILAIADDVHIVQHFTEELRANGSKEHAFKSSVQHLFAPLLGASATTALGLASLATSHVVAVRSFGIGAGVGVMVDFMMSLVLVPTMLTWVKPSAVVAPQERYFVAPMQWVARFSMRNAKQVVVVTGALMVVGLIGLRWLHVDTNHINFFAEDHPLHQSATVIDQELSGIYSFNILLEGQPDSMKSPDAMRRMEELRVRLQKLPFVKKVVSVADYVKRVNRELTSGPAKAGHYGSGPPEGGHDAADADAIPASGDAIAQELFVFGLSDEGRRELDRVVASDYSRAQMSVRLASMSSDLVFAQINRADEEAAAVFAGQRHHSHRDWIRPSVRHARPLHRRLAVEQLSHGLSDRVRRHLRRVPIGAFWRVGHHRERAAGVRRARSDGLAWYFAQRRHHHGRERRSWHRGRRHDSFHRAVPPRHGSRHGHRGRRSRWRRCTRDGRR